MPKKLIEPGECYAHTRDDYRVCVADLRFADFKVKDPDDAGWKNAILFTREDDDDTLYVRTEEDFRAKFELVDEEED